MPHLIPWRVRNLISTKAPVFYYLVNNMFTPKNSEADWDRLLEETWDDAGRTWPNRVRGIQSITRREDKILDVGCGNGSILRALKDLGYSRLFGLELSSVSVDRLSELGITMQHGKLPKIAFDDNSVDVVIASEVMEHILFHKRFLSEVHRVLKPGGQALIFVPNNCMGPISEPSHVRTYTKNSLQSLLGQFGEVRSMEIVTEEHFEAPFLFGRLVKSI